MKYAIAHENGSVAIMTLTNHMTPEEIDDHLDQFIFDNPGYISARPIPDNAIPEDRTFRDAWTDDKPTPVIDIDINKAYEIKRNEFRVLRAPLLAQLDIEYMRADEAQDETKKQQIIDKKQQLRDVTKEQLPSDIDALKAYLPNCLKST